MPTDHSLLGYAIKRSRLAGRAILESCNIPWFLPLDRLKSEAGRKGNSLISFANYDYLGVADHPAIKKAAHAAVDDFGVGALGSRLVGGERLIHADFEQKLAQFMGVDSCLTLVSGYLTNLSTINYLMGKLDLVLFDELSHNSIVTGVMGCSAQSMEFRHNDMAHLREILQQSRGNYRNCLIVVESLYSMDGDIADLPALLELKEEFGCWLLVDEAHSIGVLGKTGRGLSEHFGVDPRRTDIIVGTLSKTFAACGGFICAQGPVLELMRYSLPGFVYSVGLPPVIAAAARAALELLIAEPDRVTTLRNNARYFLKAANSAGLDTGKAIGDAIVPVLLPDLGSTIGASEVLLQNDIYAPPIVHMGVPKGLPRIRFFMSARHTAAEIDRTVGVLAAYTARDRVETRAAASGA
jgi:8-amino-7-oxononanoate synthase